MLTLFVILFPKSHGHPVIKLQNQIYTSKLRQYIQPLRYNFVFVQQPRRGSLKQPENNIKIVSNN